MFDIHRVKILKMQILPKVMPLDMRIYQHIRSVGGYYPRPPTEILAL